MTPARPRTGAPGFLSTAGCALGLWLTAPVLAAPAPPTERLVGLVPSQNPAITASLAAGARWALARTQRDGGPQLRLAIGRAGDHWGTLTPAIVELVEQRRVLALITPPERAIAHLVAQIGTRSQLPVVTTSSAASVTAAGSRWVVAAVETSADGTDLRAPLLQPSDRFAAEFRAAFHRLDGSSTVDGWTAAGHDAALLVWEALRGGAAEPRAIADDWLDGRLRCGATGPFRIEIGGRRVDLAGSRSLCASSLRETPASGGSSPSWTSPASQGPGRSR